VWKLTINTPHQKLLGWNTWKAWGRWEMNYMNLDVKLGGKYYLQTCNRWVGSIKMDGTEKENIVRAFEHVQQMPASQEGICSEVLRYAANQNGVRTCNIQNEESEPLNDFH